MGLQLTIGIYLPLLISPLAGMWCQVFYGPTVIFSLINSVCFHLKQVEKKVIFLTVTSQFPEK